MQKNIQHNIQSQFLYITMLAVAMSLAGSSVVVGKIMISQLPVYFGTFCSLVVAFLCMVPLMKNKYQELKSLTGKQWGFLFLQGLCGIVLFRVFTLYGLHSTGAVQAGIITGTTPAILALLSFMLLRERLPGASILGIILAVSGCIIINILASENYSQNSLIGCFFVLLAVICEALFTIFRKKIAFSVSPVTNTTVLIFCSLTLLSVPAYFDFVSFRPVFTLSSVLIICYYGVFATVIAYLLWTWAVAYVSGAVAGASTAAMPASSVILASVVLGENIMWQHLLGCLLIVIGIIITAFYSRNR